MVFEAAVFDTSTSIWVAGWSIGFVAGCGCNDCGMCVTWMVVWAVVGACSSIAWDEPSVGSSFPGLFLGGILWVFFEAHKRWAPMMVSTAGGCRAPTKSGVKGMGMIIGHAASGTKTLVNQFAT
jgi:hypothetical protein